MKPEVTEKIVVNGYSIVFNEFFNEWHITHPEIGFCTYFKHNEKDLAIDYCERG